MREQKVLGLSVMTAFLLTGCVQKSINTSSSNAYHGYAQPTTFQSEEYGDMQNSQVLSSSLGKASWYGKKFHGKKTASGEIYDMNAKTAAHKTLPMGTVVRVTDIINGKSVVVKINDVGPNVPGRDIDLSYAAAKSIGLIERGVTDVRIEVLGNGDGQQSGRMAQGNITPENCPDCFTTLTKSPNPTYASRGTKFNTGMNKVNTLNASIPQNTIEYDYSQSPFMRDHMDEIYQNPYADNNAAYPTHNTQSNREQIAVQVGAFRQIAGATEYANRYSSLDVNHRANIKTYIENAQPLYKVHIEGFSNDAEARQFIDHHNLNTIGAFPVWR